MKKENCIVAQSGGPTAAINASLAGVIDGVRKSGSFTRIYGSLHGTLPFSYVEYTGAYTSHVSWLLSLQAPGLYRGSRSI